MNQVIRRRAAREDLVGIFFHFVMAGSPAAARRFREHALATMQRLASRPGMGALYNPDHPALAELRFFPVSGFKNYLVFYRTAADGIEVVRVLHGARDIHGILSDDPDVDEDDDDDITYN
jgi:toxin ParE1/3/4